MTMCQVLFATSFVVIASSAFVSLESSLFMGRLELNLASVLSSMSTF